MPKKNQCAGCLSDLGMYFLQCSLCSKRYDLDCCRLDIEQYKKLSDTYKTTWSCVACCSSRRKGGDNTNTPVRGVRGGATADAVPPSTRPNENVTIRPKGNAPAPISDDEGMYVSECRLREILQHELKSTIRTYVSEELKHINVQLSEFKESLTFFNQQYEDLKNKFDEKCTVMNRLETENIALASSVKDLSVRLTLVEQHMRENNVEINGVPEHRTENLVITVKQLAEVVKSPVDDGDILHVARVAKLDKNSSRPRSVIVKLRSPRQRDALLAAVSKFNRNKQNLDKLSSQHLGIAGPQTPIFVAEHLTPANKSLHAATRKKAKEMGYKFVWVRNGRIFVRKSEESGGVLFISDKDSLNKII